ncbi:hypothetical protein AB395_00002877 [Sinorhizobium fredii CCBAU 45436]|nr:hypothetical protein AB395_00002877 [Sinorhizobium fredii CCBAU 45436]
MLKSGAISLLILDCAISWFLIRGRKEFVSGKTSISRQLLW